ncbi:hypothetical protein BRD14_01590 [Halobacteriales archaeon SW_5_68_122]|nr:MAG: hypothetical protein BRD14_01590 [Halobacteriales archaeon SW_5_68_122]
MGRRRRLLSVAAATVAGGFTGCTDDPGSGEGMADDPGTDAATPATDGGTATGANDLDLREANVAGVELEARDGGAYRFAVTLIHDDDGEDGYANWWQVETLDGDRLGRRDLAHAHGTREFTRSETVDVPESADCVVVRGHDRTHGYGGQAALVDPESGVTHLVRQGPDRSAFDATDCPE